MGLDSFWVMPNETEENPVDHPHFDPSLHLCGGMFSGNGNEGSFRGKVYSDLIETVTGVSLYQKSIENDVIVKMAELLEQELGVPGGSYYEISKEEFLDLKRMFRAYADAGASLKGWW